MNTWRTLTHGYHSLRLVILNPSPRVSLRASHAGCRTFAHRTFITHLFLLPPQRRRRGGTAVARAAPQHGEKVHQEGRMEQRRPQWQWPAARLLAGSRRQEGSGSSEQAAAGGSGEISRGGSLYAEAALAAMGRGTRHGTRVGQRAADAGTERSRVAAVPSSN